MMKMNVHLSRLAGAAFATMLSLLSLTCRAAEAIDADAIMARADQSNRPKYEVARIRMELVDDSAGALTRELTWHFVNTGDNRTSLLKFTAPASVKGIGTLVLEEAGKANAIWHYVPATRNVRRISAEHRQNRFMGTELVFEDFEGLKLAKYKFRLLREEPCRQTSRCYLIEGVADDAEERDSSTYGKKIFWIDQISFVIVKTELYGRDGALAKVFENSDFRQLAGYSRPRRQVMLNSKTNRSTVLTEIERTVDVPFDRHYVSQQYLRSD